MTQELFPRTANPALQRTRVRSPLNAISLGAFDPINRDTRRHDMRTALFLTSGLLFLASVLIPGRLISEHFPSAPNVALALGLCLWLAATGTNMWIGVSKAGYSVADELPIFLLLFSIPAVAGSVDTVAVPMMTPE
jgi:hypothetical protein